MYKIGLFLTLCLILISCGEPVHTVESAFDDCHKSQASVNMHILGGCQLSVLKYFNYTGDEAIEYLGITEKNMLTSDWRQGWISHYGDIENSGDGVWNVGLDPFCSKCHVVCYDMSNEYYKACRHMGDIFTISVSEEDIIILCPFAGDGAIDVDAC